MHPKRDSRPQRCARGRGGPLPRRGRTGAQASAGSHPQPRPLRRGHTHFGAVKQFCRRTRGARRTGRPLPGRCARPLGPWTESPRTARGDRRAGCPAFSPGGGELEPRRRTTPPTGSCGRPAPGWPALVADAGSLPRGRRAVRTSPGGPPGAGPRRPRRAGRIAPSISASFQFLPTSGGNRGAGGVQVTLRGRRDFPETKKPIDARPPRSSFPKGRGAPPSPAPGCRGQVAPGLAPAEGTHPRGPEAPTGQGLARQAAPAARCPRGRLSAGPLPAPTEERCPLSPAHLLHLLPPPPSAGDARSLLGPEIPGPRARTGQSAADLRLAGPGARALRSAAASSRTRVSLGPARESSTLRGSRFNPGRRYPDAQGDTPKHRSRVTWGRGRGGPGQGGGVRGGVSPGKARDALLARPAGDSGGP